MQLVRRLYQRGYQRNDILELFRFIDWVLVLPLELEKQFWDELEQYEEEDKMTYVTSVERMGIEKGIQQGEHHLLKRQLKKRFPNLPEWVGEKLEQASQEDLEQWADRILDAQHLEDIFKP